MLGKLWKDPVWGAVIAAGIVAVLGTVGTYFLDLWPTIGRYIAGIYETAQKPNGLPNWAFWLLVLTAIPTLLLALVLVWQAIAPGSSPASWRAYLDDHFVGLRWRWKYFSDGTLGDVHSFCPHCDFQVFPRHASSYSAVDRIAFFCDACNRSLATFDESYEELESKIRRFIQQKVRNGTWSKSGDA